MYNPVKCLHPKIVRNKYTHELVSVPCGRCNACMTQRTALWTARLREESTCHPYTLFGTLTFTDDKLPLCNVYDYDSKSDSWDESLSRSSEYISYCNGNVPCFDTSIFQNFFKKLRQKISYNHGTQKEFQIRYFLAAEIGPTTYRPHAHYLLWFDSPELVSRIKSYIYEAWQSENSCSSLSDFLRRNKHVFVHGNAEAYVAQYMFKSTNLPEIFNEKPFRPFHLQSINPPIGTIRLFKNIIRGLSLSDLDTITLHRLSSGESVVLPLWRGLENRLFPKCMQFDNLSDGDRRVLYEISSFGIDREKWSAEGDSFESFCKRFLPKWFSSDHTVQLVRKVCRYSSKDCGFGKTFVGFDSALFASVLRSLRSIFNLSIRFHLYASALSISCEDYYSVITSYYKRKNYFSLLEQLKFQEYLSDNYRKDASLSFYPFIIDQLFYENLRKLPFSTYSQYLEQFGLGKINDFAFVPENNLFYQQRKSLSDKIVFDSHKSRVKKDYLATHPDAYLNSYSSLLKPFKF